MAKSLLDVGIHPMPRDALSTNAHAVSLNVGRYRGRARVDRAITDSRGLLTDSDSCVTARSAHMTAAPSPHDADSTDASSESRSRMDIRLCIVCSTIDGRVHRCLRQIDERSSLRRRGAVSGIRRIEKHALRRPAWKQTSKSSCRDLSS
jgi:hypothetical protein